MSRIMIFGLGYCAARFGLRLQAQGWSVASTGSAGTMRFDDEDAVTQAIGEATHILSSVPPGPDGDPVLQRYGSALARCDALWIGYMSSTGVYGDSGGAWIDEGSPVGGGRRSARTQADLDWQALSATARIFRLPGIYGPGRCALDRIRAGNARMIDAPGQIFSRIHVDDIVSGLVASLSGPPGIYNLADDLPCSQNDVIAYGCALLGTPLPPLKALEEAGLSPAARAFYTERRRVANGRARRLLGWTPRFRDYRSGLAACLAAEACTEREDHSTQRQQHA